MTKKILVTQDELLKRRAVRIVMELYYAMKAKGAQPTLKDLLQLAAKIKGL